MNVKTTFIISFITIIISSNLFLAQNSNLLVSNDVDEEKIVNGKTEDSNNPTSEFLDTKSKTNFEIANNSSLYNNGINYNLKKSGFVTLKIFDYNGNEVASLISREQKAGHHFANFSNINLSSGIYQYQLSVDNVADLPKMMFVN